MRIEDVRVTGLRNLQDFSVHFEESQFTSVLIGENGTGKSNLLEAIVRIFRDLDLGERPDFGFEITYHCRGQRVRVIGTPGTRQTIYVGPAAAEKRLTWKAFQHRQRRTSAKVRLRLLLWAINQNAALF